ncbi:hypothetical protein [Nocardioides caldifontis]|uniref:hypothetical protein n=1 Tax=Nocardioides caldifontis TaxID=2588938 RepID=UPI0011DF7299|nr:hypothetical protein [Nocardioides caldifontis]
MSHLLVVLSNALPGREDEFNEWYDAVHVHEMVDVLDGVRSAQRFVRAGPDDTAPPYKYLALYEVDDVELAREQLRLQQEDRAEAAAAGRAPLISPPRAMAADALVGFFSAIGPRVDPARDPSRTATTHER